MKPESVFGWCKVYLFSRCEKRYFAPSKTESATDNFEYLYKRRNQ